MERDGTGRNGNLKERKGIRWNVEGPDGTEDLMERRGTSWNGGTQDGTEGNRMECRGTRRDGET